VEIKALLFDLGRVLVDFDMAECEAILTSRSILEHDELMRVLWDTGWARQYERGEVSAGEFYRFVEREAELSMDYDEFMKCWTEIFDPIPILPDHVLPALAKAYPMTLVSNTNQAHADYVRENYDVLPFFDNHIFSYQVGALKPDCKMFERAIEVTGFPPGNLLFVDDRSENIESAEELGLHTHWFRSVPGLLELLGQMGVDLDRPEADLDSDR
jgi:HAD superfamily hydrolase (TIGR01493 family)